MEDSECGFTGSGVSLDSASRTCGPRTCYPSTGELWSGKGELKIRFYVLHVSPPCLQFNCCSEINVKIHLNVLILLDPLQFMGKWYQVAVVSTCTHFMKRKSRNPDIVPMVLQHVDSELNFTKTATSFRSDFSSCWTQFGDFSGTWTEFAFDPSVGTARARRWPHSTVWPPRRAAFSTMFQVCSCLLCFILLQMITNLSFSQGSDWMWILSWSVATTRTWLWCFSWAQRSCQELRAPTSFFTVSGEKKTVRRCFRATSS